MTRAGRSLESTGLLSRRHLFALLATLAAGCTGEPEPLRSTDLAKSRAAVLKKVDDPRRPPGLPKSTRVR